MTSESTLLRAAETAFPPVTTALCREMQPTLYRYLWRVSASQQLRLCLLTVLVFPLSMVPLELQRRMVDGAVAGERLELLLWLGAVYLAVVLVHGGLKYGLNVYQGMVSEGVIRVLRMRVSRSPARESGHGALVSMAAAEAEQLGGFVGEGVAFPLLQGGIVVTVLGYMLWVEPLVAAVAIALFVPALALVPRVQDAINRRVERRTALVRELGDALSENGGGDDARDQRFNALIQDIYRVRLRIVALKHLLKFFNNLLGHLGPLGVLVVGGWLVLEGRTEVGVIVAFISGYERVIDPLRQLLNFYRRLSQMRVQYAMLPAALG